MADISNFGESAGKAFTKKKSISDRIDGILKNYDGDPEKTLGKAFSALLTSMGDETLLESLSDQVRRLENQLDAKERECESIRESCHELDAEIKLMELRHEAVDGLLLEILDMIDGTPLSAKVRRMAEWHPRLPMVIGDRVARMVTSA